MNIKKPENIRFIVLSLIIVLGLFIIFIAANKPSSSPQSSANTSSQAITLKQITKNLDSGSLLIDVRTSEEYTAQHAVGAINMPLADIQAGKTPNVTKNKIIYVYCHTGVRAGEAKTILSQEGYSNVISLGGLGNWIALGGKVTPSQTN
jgi:rhodanese-related sulfurtransferase